MSTTPVIDAPAPLALVVTNNGLDLNSNQSILAPFTSFLAQAEEWKARVATIKITDPSDTRQMKLARESRLALKEIRCDSDRKRKQLKDESLKRGRMIDGLHAVVEGLISPLEAQLLEQEQFAERQEAARKAKLKADREELLRPYGADTSFYDLGAMDDNTFKDLMDGMRAAAEKKAEDARVAEVARIAAEKAERERKEQLRIENERLKKEAAESAARAKAEKDAADAKARAEREAHEAILRKEREEAAARERALKAEADAAAKKAREVEQAAAAERKRIADAEKARADAAAAETRRLQELARKAALAPDKEKLLAVAATIRRFQVPEMMSADGISAQIDILERVDELAQYVENLAEKF